MRNFYIKFKGDNFITIDIFCDSFLLTKHFIHFYINKNCLISSICLLDVETIIEFECIESERKERGVIYA